MADRIFIALLLFLTVATVYGIDNFILVEGGSYKIKQCKDCDNIITVNIPSFYMSQYEYTCEETSQLLNKALQDKKITVNSLGTLFLPGSNIELTRPSDAMEYFENYLDFTNGRFSFKEGYGKHPLVYISWLAAVVICNLRSHYDSLETVYTIDEQNVICNWKKNGYRLPSEAEWEFAASCRGLYTTHSYGNGLPTENVADISIKKLIPEWKIQHEKYNDGYAYTSPIGVFKPNKLGLYDMEGNGSEWCWNRANHTPLGYSIDPTVENYYADYRSNRGTSFYDRPKYNTIKTQRYYSPTAIMSMGAIRMVRNSSQ